jgi:cation/acetate symporter
MDNSAQAKKERALFPAQLIRSEMGVGSDSSSGH